MPKAQTRRYSNVLANRKSVVTLPRQVTHVGRNDPCPCGSGKKYKSCHASEGEAFLQKLARKQEKQRLKDEGRSWLLRWLK